MAEAGFGIAIMAAGKGTRLKSRRPKVLHEIGGRALLLHVIAVAETIAPASEILCIVGHEAERVRSAVESTGVQFVHQTEQRGTGHALQMVKAWFTTSGATLPENIMVLSGDVPLIKAETLARFAAFHREHHAAMTILTAIPSNPFGYGRVNRKGAGEADVLGIVEQKDLPKGDAGSAEINSGIYCFQTEKLFAKLDQLNDKNASGELYLTDVAGLLVADGEKVVATVADSIDEVLGANTIAEMMHLDAAMRLDTARKLMAQGVTIFRPETCVIDSTVTVGPDTVLEPYVQLLGKTTIGTESRIRSYSVVKDSTIGDNVLLRNGCILEDSIIGDGALLGPYAHLRPGSDIGPAAHVGNFVETKKVKLGKGSKANHLNYLGDAVIGEGVNIGAGAITCNYDGVHKHQTTIGNGVFVGSDSTLVAPVTLGDGSYVAAGSCITDDVPADALALGRSRQTTKEGWVSARRKKREELEPK
ncbi:bifunctional UDP-N-acetylglucosamine diphosphorylase/glucosamine-1-phosphate N-acetyltransferase GlmU [Granulicella cerasi]|uniref:Bifunctional protein GlmU n=1 Tax=Granulicella cerasi TaxID=741063 RepID=A0ABW1Z3G5_9BACT|nr:bifunctional UDP-N-acetylglucosamine diphosphorylase/glucosamine-1-phosphate N-acetyltransferase GlmU [Granulicella cerasi]